MSFLHPLWLWAAAAVAVPVVIHLLSRGRGRVIPLGTTRFLPTSRSHRLRRLRPSGLLRLLLRAALLASLAVALAAPRYWRTPEAQPDQTWALVDTDLVVERARLEASSPDAFRRLDRLDTTRRLLLAPGLPEWSDGTAPLDAELVSALDDHDLWSLVAEGAAMVPPEAALEIFVLDRVETLAGARPDLGRPFEWWSVSDPELNRWVQRAVRTEAGLKVTIGVSDDSGTVFASYPVDPTSTTEYDAGVSLETGPDGELVSLRDGGGRASDDRTLVAESPPLRASVSAPPDRSDDQATVLRAAEAVADHLGRPLVVADGVSETPDLAVSLGDSADTIGLGAVPGSAPGSAAVTLLAQEGADRPCRESVYIAALPDPWLDLRRCADMPAGGLGDSRVGYWRDARGRPLLSVEPRRDGVDPAGAVYRWSGRLDPDWSTLADSGLPHLLLGLVEPDDERLNGSGDAGSDRRAAPTGHGRPRGSSVASRPDPVAPDPLPERIAWILVATLFLIDRLLVGRAR